MKPRRNTLSRNGRPGASKAGAVGLLRAAPRGLPATAPGPAPGVHDPSALPAELKIDGQTEGSIHYAGTVRVGPQGAVTGEIHAQTIIVEGAIDGDLHASTAVCILAGARVTGDVKAPRLALLPGARLRGRITMKRGPEPESVLDDRGVEALLTRARRP
jgi:cytoskeletal protein CcmA (bactofilin family)